VSKMKQFETLATRVFPKLYNRLNRLANFTCGVWYFRSPSR
jgi:hypothetical protein